jgi:2-polyprenyl-3-methyl-5-hydroxy-6-metoxy-1,4-benzoquinol methylase
MPHNYFQGDAESHINIKRIELIKSLNIDFKDKKVLETGMGSQGDISKYLYDAGADLYCFDARQENIDYFKIRHPYITNVFNIDLEQPNALASIGVQFDYIVCMGTLHHLGAPKQALEEMAKYSNNLIMTTCIERSPGWNYITEGDLEHASFSGQGCRPYPATLETELNALYTTVETNHQVIHGDFTGGFRRAYVCYK